jgi:hypothetical protein
MIITNGFWLCSKIKFRFWALYMLWRLRKLPLLKRTAVMSRYLRRSIHKINNRTLKTEGWVNIGGSNE